MEASSRSEPPPPPPGWYTNPTGPGQRYWDGARWTDSYAPPPSPLPPPPSPPPHWQAAPSATASQSGAPGIVIAGYIFAIVIPIIGFVLGIVALTQQNDAARHGIGIIVVSVIGFMLWVLLIAL